MVGKLELWLLGKFDVACKGPGGLCWIRICLFQRLGASSRHTSHPLRTWMYAIHHMAEIPCRIPFLHRSLPHECNAQNLLQEKISKVLAKTPPRWKCERHRPNGWCNGTSFAFTASHLKCKSKADHRTETTIRRHRAHGARLPLSDFRPSDLGSLINPTITQQSTFKCPLRNPSVDRMWAIVLVVESKPTRTH